MKKKGKAKVKKVISGLGKAVKAHTAQAKLLKSALKNGKGLGFRDESSARSSVSKIRRSGRSHAHKTQAAIAMEQRARVAGKSKPAAIYRKFIEAQKKITKRRA